MCWEHCRNVPSTLLDLLPNSRLKVSLISYNVAKGVYEKLFRQTFKANFSLEISYSTRSDLTASPSTKTSHRNLFFRLNIRRIFRSILKIVGVFFKNLKLSTRKRQQS